MLYTSACSFILWGFCTKHQLLPQHFHYMHVPPLNKAHQLSVLLTRHKNKSRHTGSMFCRTADVSSRHSCKVIQEGFWAENELNIKSNYMVLLLVLSRQRIRERYHLPDLGWDQEQSDMVLPLMVKFYETLAGQDMSWLSKVMLKKKIRRQWKTTWAIYKA